MTEVQKLRSLAKLMASTGFNTPEAYQRYDQILDRLGDLLPLDQFEAFCQEL
jgi:hypothetical protein